jgi:hypothetical protein
VNIIVNSKYYKAKYSYHNICYICDKFFIQLVYFLSLASLTICCLYEIVMVICEIECQLTKESKKLSFIYGHVNIIIVTAEGIICIA